MEIIDCTTKSGFSKRKVKQFSNFVKDDETIEFVFNDAMIIKTTKQRLVDEVMANPNCKGLLNDTDIASFKTENVELKFNGQTFNWWIAEKDRLDLFKSFIDNTEVKTKKTEKMTKATKTITDNANKTKYNETKYSVGIATLVDNELTNIHYFEGTKQECIDFINKDMFDRYVDDSLNAKVVINLAFDIDEFKDVFFADTPKESKDTYKKNIEMWYTLQELEDMGAISVK